jgi:RNA polymerase sigma-70 factor (ECF subfamily)
MTFDLIAYQAANNQLKQQMTDTLFKQQYPFVYRLAFNLCGNLTEAQDIAQETFVAALKGLDGFKGEAQISTWLYRITTRIAGRSITKTRRAHADKDNIDDFAALDQAEQLKINHDLVKALSQLSVPHRTVLALVAIEGHSHQTAADVLGVPVGTIWSRLHSARKQLLAAMG